MKHLLRGRVRGKAPILFVEGCSRSGDKSQEELSAGSTTDVIRIVDLYCFLFSTEDAAKFD